LITRAAVILPFEEPLLRSHGIDATFVGHPLLDRALHMPDRQAARAELGVAPNERLLALFPGSRQQEIARHFDDFVATARLVSSSVLRLRVMVCVAPTVRIDPARCPFPMIHNASLGVLRAADAALCKSGTTTLEAAVAGCPMAVAYRTSPWTYAIARRAVTIPRIGLVNVVAGHEVAPEFVQDALRPADIAAVLTELLNPESVQRAQQVRGLADVRAKLGSPGAAERVAAIADELLG
jgi:lipid-A-disaccharide synthase